MINKKISRRYSSALYEVALSRKITDKIRKDISSLKKIIETSRDLRLFIENPIISQEKKRSIFKKIFAGKLNELTLDFFDILSEKNRENLLYDISIDFLNLLNEKEGIVEVEIKTAIEISESIKKNLSDKLKVFTGKKILATYSVDRTLKGGFTARMDDTILDASIKRQLELLYNQFKEGSFSST